MIADKLVSRAIQRVDRRDRRRECENDRHKVAATLSTFKPTTAHCSCAHLMSIVFFLLAAVTPLSAGKYICGNRRAIEVVAIIIVATFVLYADAACKFPQEWAGVW